MRRPLAGVTFENSSLFRSHPAPGLLPQGSNLAKPASHAVLPPKAPSSVDLVPLIGSAVSCPYPCPSLVNNQPELLIYITHDLFGQ